MFWADVMSSIWIGGNADGGLHERAPYWLNGVVPLAYLLKNAGVSSRPPHHHKHPTLRHAPVAQPIDGNCTLGLDMRNNDLSFALAVDAKACQARCVANYACNGFVFDNCTVGGGQCWLKSAIGETSAASCRCFGTVRTSPIPPVDMYAQATKYISHILASQNADGWLGPESANPKTDGGQYWGPSNVLFSLWQWAEGEMATASDASVGSAAFKNATSAMLAHLLEQKKRMATAKMTSWAGERWIDMALSAEFLIDNAAAAGISDADVSLLLGLVEMLHAQGVDWDGWFETFTGDAGGHNVNNAQGLKSAAVWFRYSNNDSMAQLSKDRMANLDKLYGLPTGMYNGDEILPVPATRSPSRGIELCGVVEAMFSYTTMFSVHGDLTFADRAERIAYNALPATWASPKGGDMWAHQYLQAVNEINAIKADPHTWQHDGDMAETYGLEPNYGCCTANFNQGAPLSRSLALSLFRSLVPWRALPRNS